MRSTMNHIFADYRDKHGLTQAELAERIGVSRQMVNFIENGERNITPENADAWGKKLGIPREKLHPVFKAVA